MTRALVPALALALAALGTAGCAGSGSTRASADVMASPVSVASAAALRDGQVVEVGNIDRGRVVFRTNCSTCHGETGTEGGVGPSLRGERTRKDLDSTIVWIEHPLPPMPALYPAILTARDVSDVATYVESL